MEQSSLYNPGFVGTQFNWWIGQVAASSTWRENMKDTPYEKREDIPGWGYRYKVRIMGLHDGGESVIPSDQLPWAQVMYSVWGGGQGGSFQTPGIKEGMFVFGFFLDGSDEQIPVIMGVLGNNAKTTIKGVNSKVGVDTVTDESSVFEPRSGFTDDGTTVCSDNQIRQEEPKSSVTNESTDGTLLLTISDKIQTQVQNEEHPVECPKTKNSLTSLNTHMSNFQVEYQRLLEKVNDFPTAAASKGINESIDKLIEKTAGLSAKSMLTTLNNQQTFLLEKLNDATAIFEQEENISNRLNILQKNLEGQGKLSCIFGKIKGDLADLIKAAMKKNLNRKNSAPPAGSYNPSNPCETEEIIAEVMAGTQGQISGGFMDAVKSLAGGQGVPSLGRLGTAFNKLNNLNIPSELDVASLLPSFNQSLDVGGLLGKLPPIGGFDIGQELSFDMALANVFISSIAAFTECDPPEECPETDTLTLGGDQTKKSETDPVNTDNIAKLESEKINEKQSGKVPPEIGDVVTKDDGTKQYYTGVSENEDGELVLNNEKEDIKYEEPEITTFKKPIIKKQLVVEESVDIDVADNTIKVETIERTSSSTEASGFIRGGEVVGASSNTDAANEVNNARRKLDLAQARRRARQRGDDAEVNRLTEELNKLRGR